MAKRINYRRQTTRLAIHSALERVAWGLIFQGEVEGLNVWHICFLCDILDSHFHISGIKGCPVHYAAFWLLTHLAHTDVDTYTDTQSGPYGHGEVGDHTLPHKCPWNPLYRLAEGSCPEQ